MAVYHLSYDQAIAAVVITGRRMLGLNWEFFDESDVITVDTVPDRKMNRKMNNAYEAFNLSEVVNLMLEDPEGTTVTYHDDGSRSKGVGGYSVQGVTIKDRFYALPTLSITSETRQNLAELKVTILKLLSIVSGVSLDALWQKVNFVMGDGTAHNTGVESIVSEILDVEHVPGRLHCQVHPSLMFVRELEAVWKEIDSAIGPEKVFAHFPVSLSDTPSSVTEQWINCALRLVTRDFNHKESSQKDFFSFF